MNAAEFLQELKKERLSGREFLALIGHTEISNEDYSEIKENPSMTYARLVEILQNAPISGGEYDELLRTARYRQKKQAQKKNREDLESRLTKLLAGESAAETHESEKNLEKNLENTDNLDNTEEIFLLENLENLSKIDITSYSEPSADELWEGEKPLQPNLDTPDLLDEYAEYGGKDDFDRDARRENLVKIIICISLGIVLGFTSFIIRYLGLTNFVENPKSYEDIFELQKTSQPNRKANDEIINPFRAENFTDSANPLNQITSNERYIFKVIDNNIHAVEIDSGQISDAPNFVYADYSENGDCKGILETRGGLYAIYENSYENTLKYKLSEEDNEKEGEEEDESNNPTTFAFEQPQITIYRFNSQEFTGIPESNSNIDGNFVSAFQRGERLIIISDFVPQNNRNPNEYIGYIPSYSTDGERVFTDFENIEFIAGKTTYSNMMVVGMLGISTGEITVCAVSGDSASNVYVSPGGSSLIMGFYSPNEHKTHILRQRISGGELSEPIHNTVSGEVRKGFIDERGDVTRIVSYTGDSAELHLFSTGGRLYSRVGKIASGEGIAGVAFDENAVYIISEQSDDVYAIDVSEPLNPLFRNELNTDNVLISNEVFYRWNDERFFTTRLETEQRAVTITMYNGPSIEATYRIPVDDELWYERTRISVERLWGNAASSYDATTGVGVIIIPVTFFNPSLIECFFVLNYNENTGFGKVGSITEITGTELRFGRTLNTVIRSGYIYTIWDDFVQSATFDSETIMSHRF